MKKFQVLILAFLFLIVLPSVSFADKWTKTDTAFQLVYTGLHIVDWGQTRWTTKNYDKFHETNFILGESPSIDGVDAYFVITLIGHGAVSYFLPDRAKVFSIEFNPRRVWQLIGIGVEIGAVINNFSIGVKTNF